jgi:hypothetical protein
MRGAIPHPQYVMSCCSVNYKDNFTFTLYKLLNSVNAESLYFDENSRFGSLRTRICHADIP